MSITIIIFPNYTCSFTKFLNFHIILKIVIVKPLLAIRRSLVGYHGDKSINGSITQVSISRPARRPWRLNGDQESILRSEWGLASGGNWSRASETASLRSQCHRLSRAISLWEPLSHILTWVRVQSSDSPSRDPVLPSQIRRKKTEIILITFLFR